MLSTGTLGLCLRYIVSVLQGFAGRGVMGHRQVHWDCVAVCGKCVAGCCRARSYELPTGILACDTECCSVLQCVAVRCSAEIDTDASFPYPENLVANCTLTVPI